MRLLEDSQMRWVSGGAFSAGDDERSPGGQPPRDPDEPSPVPRQEEEPPRGIVDTLPERICDSGHVKSLEGRIVIPGKEAAVGKVGPVSGLEASQGESVMEIKVECNSKKNEEDEDDD